YWEPLDAAHLRAVDELLADGMISEETWSVLAASLDEKQLLDLIYTVGVYDTTAFVVRSLGVALDHPAPAERTPPPWSGSAIRLATEAGGSGSSRELGDLRFERLPMVRERKKLQHQR